MDSVALGFALWSPMPINVAVSSNLGHGSRLFLQAWYTASWTRPSWYQSSHERSGLLHGRVRDTGETFFFSLSPHKKEKVMCSWLTSFPPAVGLSVPRANLEVVWTWKRRISSQISFATARAFVAFFAGWLCEFDYVYKGHLRDDEYTRGRTSASRRKPKTKGKRMQLRRQYNVVLRSKTFSFLGCYFSRPKYYTRSLVKVRQFHRAFTP